MLVLVAYPVLSSLYLSFTDWNLIEGTSKFIGLFNYSHLFQEPLFRKVLLNTTYFTLLYVGAVTIISLALALMLQNMPNRFTNIVRTICFIPVIISMAAAAIIWQWLYQPAFGIINYLLKSIGMHTFNWTRDANIALNSVIIMSVWKSLGFVLVIFIAGILGIPETYYEAARIDGASSFQTSIRITLPLLKDTTLFVLVTQIIGAFQVFTQTFVITRGGPGNASETMVMEIYFRGFQYYKMGEASALAYILFAILLGLTIMQLKLFDYENADY
jgi:multiple sugar transport system permease protein